MAVRIYVSDMGAAADAGGARADLTNGDVLLALHTGITADEQIAIVAELLSPAERETASVHIPGMRVEASA